MLEIILLGAVGYGVYTGRLTDARAAARMAGRWLGRTATAMRRVRAEAANAAARAAASNPELGASTAGLQASLAQLGAVTAEASSLVSGLRPGVLRQDVAAAIAHANASKVAAGGMLQAGAYSYSGDAYDSAAALQPYGGSLSGSPAYSQPAAVVPSQAPLINVPEAVASVFSPQEIALALGAGAQAESVAGNASTLTSQQQQQQQQLDARGGSHQHLAAQPYASNYLNEQRSYGAGVNSSASSSGSSSTGPIRRATVMAVYEAGSSVPMSPQAFAAQLSRGIGGDDNAPSIAGNASIQSGPGRPGDGGAGDRSLSAVGEVRSGTRTDSNSIATSSAAHNGSIESAIGTGVRMVGPHASPEAFLQALEQGSSQPMPATPSSFPAFNNSSIGGPVTSGAPGAGGGTVARQQPPVPVTGGASSVVARILQRDLRVSAGSSSGSGFDKGRKR